MEEATRECRVGGLWEILYADDLSLTAETLGDMDMMFGEWRQATKRRGLKVNFGKDKDDDDWEGDGGCGAGGQVTVWSVRSRCWS